MDNNINAVSGIMMERLASYYGFRVADGIIDYRKVGTLNIAETCDTILAKDVNRDKKM